MKKDILKIAGVKSEEEFYYLYPTEEAFKRAFPKEFKKARMGASMVKKQLTQLTDFANPPQAQDGVDMLSQFIPQLASYKKGKINSPTGQVTKQQTEALGYKSDGSNFNTNNFALGMQKFGKDIGEGYDKLDSSLGQIGGVSGALGIGKDLLGGFQQLKQEKDAQKQAHQFNDISNLTNQVAGLKPDIASRKYVRHEDMQMNPNQFGQSLGSAPNNPYLQMQEGGSVGGNPTELQNMYTGGDNLYSDLGYEPLDDVNVIKRYRRGGYVPRAQFGAVDKMAGQAGGALGSLIGGGHGRPTAGGQIGSTIGSTVGKFIPIPGASAVLGGVGGLVGGIFGGQSAKKTEDWQNQGLQNMQNSAFTQGSRALQAQNSAYMEDGGWVSHNWQPQTITKFGDYNVEDLLRRDPMMDTLRSGGHLNNYAPPSAQAMSTERMAMGGQLKTTWGGHAEPISHNPYLPGSGETVMFRGNSHEESDGNGHTGIGVKYGSGSQDDYTDYAQYGTEQADADVEVEAGEPATELPDSETGENSMVVFGNMKIPSYGVSELKDPKSKGKKFKNYANDLSKIENRHSKLLQKSVEKLNSLNPVTAFEKLEFDTLSKIVDGANMSLKGLASQKKLLAGIQNSILDTAKEYGVESDALAKGKIKQDMNTDMARFGGKFTKAQSGISKSKYDPEFESFIDQAMQLEQANSSQSGDYRGGGDYFGTNNAAYDTLKKAKEYYYKKYWSKVKDLPPGLRTRALQLAINTGDPYGELMVAAGKMSVDRRRDTKDQRKDKSIVGNKDWEKNKASILKEYNKDPQAFLSKLDAEQNRYYDSLVEANTDADGKAFGSINPNTSREFFDDYLGLANFAAQPFIKKPTLQQAVQQSAALTQPLQKLPAAPTNIPQVAQQSNIPMQPSRMSSNQTFPSPVDARGEYYMPGYEPYQIDGTYTNLPEVVVRGNKPAKERVGQIPMNRNFTSPVPPDINAALPTYASSMQAINQGSTGGNQETDSRFDLMDLWRQAQPYLIPSNQENIDPNQFAAEQYDLINNVPMGVQAQQISPLLETPYSISLQDQLNANQADFNTLVRQQGYNPAAASQLAAQKYAANSAILGQQTRANQEMQMGAFNRNRGVLNDATMKNLEILDRQYGRQQQGLSNTKAQAHAALASISDKIAKHKLENRTLGIYENLYNYRFGAKGRAMNVNAPAEFNMEGNPFARTSGGKGQLAPGYDFTYDASQNIIGTRKLPKDTESDRNGGIVKAIKNL